MFHKHPEHALNSFHQAPILPAKKGPPLCSSLCSSLGDPEPSDADRRITQRLKDALGLVEIRVLDHVVVGFDGYTSFAERGWL
ncbi:RadC-like JAB domain-containing protein [Halomonas ventosae]|uniref:RadC-like JAB domain-containing protein n=1 Tax=Halomonas ventosae TaxID=229007 RepID=A0A4R6GJY5_9GAMM|nr:RadC-like JAB domain-containing protein [Halomonas ventosae]